MCKCVCVCVLERVCVCVCITAYVQSDTQPDDAEMAMVCARASERASIMREHDVRERNRKRPN